MHMVAQVSAGIFIENKIVPIIVSVHASNIGLPNLTFLGAKNGYGKILGAKLRAIFRETGWKLPAKKYTISFTPEISGKDMENIEAAAGIALLMAAERLAPPPYPIAILGSLTLQGILLPDSLAHQKIHILKDIPDIRIFLSPIRPAACWANCSNISFLSSIQLLQNTSWDSFLTAPSPSLLPPSIQPPMLHLSPTQWRVLEIFTAGRHSTLFYGTPGEGKTQCAQLSLLLAASFLEEETLASSFCNSVPVSTSPPFIGRLLRPIQRSAPVASTTPQLRSLAEQCHILILNELPLFAKSVKIFLREILERPIHPQILATMNPCACYATDPKRCTCSASTIRSYQQAMDAPLLDRFDIIYRLQTSIESSKSFSIPSYFETFIQKRNKINTAGLLQYQRFLQGAPRWNEQYQYTDLQLHTKISNELEEWFQRTISLLNISKRRSCSITRVARTIADLEGAVEISKQHLLEAIQLRPPKNLT